jgi:hypothetical protein
MSGVCATVTVRTPRPGRTGAPPSPGRGTKEANVMTASTSLVACCRAVLPATVSTVVLLVAAGSMPTPPALALVCGVGAATLLLLFGVGEQLACRTLHGTRSPTAAEAAVMAPAITRVCAAGLGPPLVRVTVQPHGQGLVAYPCGGATVVVPRALIVAVHHGRVSHEQAAASIAHAAAICSAGLTRGQVKPWPCGACPGSRWRASWPPRDQRCVASRCCGSRGVPESSSGDRGRTERRRRPPVDGRRLGGPDRRDLRAARAEPAMAPATGPGRRRHLGRARPGRALRGAARRLRAPRRPGTPRPPHPAARHRTAPAVSSSP